MKRKTLLITFTVVLSALAWTIAASAHTMAPKATVVTVTAGKPSELAFKLSTKTVKAGTITFKVTNKGVLAHTFKVCTSAKGGTANSCVGKDTPSIRPGKTVTLSVKVTKGTHEYLCSVPGHAASGMKGDIKVT